MLQTIFCSVLALGTCLSSFAAKYAPLDYPDEILRTVKEQDPESKKVMHVLQIPIAHYIHEDGRHIELIGACHIGSDDYYANINKRLQACDRVLYEMVDGELLAQKSIIRKKMVRGGISAEERAILYSNSGPSATPNMWLVRMSQGYIGLCRVLGTKLQTDLIDYGFEHYINADLSMAELDAAVKARGENWELMLKDEVLKYEALINSNKSKSEIKMEMLRLAVEPFRDTPIYKSALVHSRNARAIEVLAKELQNPAYRHIGIFYGAAHMPGLHEGILKLGFTLKDVESLPAFKSDPIEDEPAVELAPAA